MSKIDWTKPLRMVNASHVKNPREFKHTGGRNVIIEYQGNTCGSRYYTVVDKNTGKSFEPGGYDVENVPEEPNDHLHLYYYAGSWQINVAGSLGPNQMGPKQLQPKSYWEKAGPSVIVKVEA